MEFRIEYKPYLYGRSYEMVFQVCSEALKRAGKPGIISQRIAFGRYENELSSDFDMLFDHAKHSIKHMMEEELKAIAIEERIVTRLRDDGENYIKELCTDTPL